MVEEGHWERGRKEQYQGGEGEVEVCKDMSRKGKVEKMQQQKTKHSLEMHIVLLNDSTPPH